MPEKRRFVCGDCGNVWETPFGEPRPLECPDCGSKKVRCHSDNPGRGQGRGRGRGQGGGGRGQGGGRRGQ